MAWLPFKEISEHGIFHGIVVWQESKPLKTKDKNVLLIIEWGKAILTVRSYFKKIGSNDDAYCSINAAVRVINDGTNNKYGIRCEFSFG